VGVIDASTWQALGITLSMLGLVLSFVLWRVRGPAAGIRGVAWSLLPAAAGLTGTLKLLWEIGDSVVNWAVRLVFSPVVWLGIILAGVSVVLFGVSAAMRSRGVGRAGGAAGPGKVGGKRAAGGDKALPAERGTRKAQPAVKDDDMDDIEAILKKHGIS
jgi:hypothetical protein